MSSADGKVDITDEVVRQGAGEYADVIKWLRAGLKSQATYLRGRRDRAFRRAYQSQIIIILLGLIASMAAIYSKDTTVGFLLSADNWSRVNIIAPLLISALGSLLTLADFRGVFARNSAAFNVISTVKSEIDYLLLLGPDNGKPRITKPMIDDWNQKVSTAMVAHSEEWQQSMTSEKK